MSSTDHSSRGSTPTPPSGQRLGDQLAERVEGISPEAIEQFIELRIAHRIRRLARAYRLSADQQDDLAQEFLLALAAAIPGYRPGQVRWTTFIRAVLDRRYRHQVRQLTGPKYRRLGGPASGNERIGELVDPKAHTVYGPPGIDQRLDIEAIMAALPASLGEVASLLPHCSQRQIARRLGRSSATICRDVSRIREHFRRAGYDPDQNSCNESAGAAKKGN